ncbi:hypothetical protein DYE48_01520 [Halobacillus trueperi]|uniref:Uncharacterized protein n=1 Tax=Halobacillus trueperi TaxID=156205 RepID=A0A3E0JDV7_9BACI|nr:hypothetical protein DYE48_01520 [Halobacillus trueperi]
MVFSIVEKARTIGDGELPPLLTPLPDVTKPFSANTGPCTFQLSGKKIRTCFTIKVKQVL